MIKNLNIKKILSFLESDGGEIINYSENSINLFFKIAETKRPTKKIMLEFELRKYINYGIRYKFIDAMKGFNIFVYKKGDYKNELQLKFKNNL